MTRGTDQVVVVLRKVKELLAASHPSNWAALTPKDVIAIIDRETNSLLESGQFQDKVELASLFAPTAEIQEISIANQWSSDYMRLSAAFDEAVRNIS